MKTHLQHGITATAAKRLCLSLLAGLVLLVVPGCIGRKAPVAENLLLGNPSGANRSDPDNYLIERPQFALSYNRRRGIPNWVSWELDAGWLGKQPRSQFVPDDELPGSWYRATPTDYTGTGFDRGHMIPSADRDRTLQDNQAVFRMTNIVPQAPDNNQGPWKKLEDYCRELAGEGKELAIVAGNYGTRRRIARGRIAVPAHLWKVVVILDRPGSGAEGVSRRTRVIAVDLPNTQGIRYTSWKQYLTSVDRIESATGYDLLSAVSREVQQVVESRIDRDGSGFKSRRNRGQALLDPSSARR